MSRKHRISNFVSIRDFSIRMMSGESLTIDESSNAAAFLKSVYRQTDIKYPKFFKMDTLSKLAFIAVELLLKDRKIDEKYSAEEIAVIMANSSSSLNTDIDYQKTISDKNNYFPSPAVFVYTLPNILIGEICIRHKIKGENLFLISERFNPVNLVFFAESLLNSGKAGCVICGWTELSADGQKFDAFVALIENENTNNENNFLKFETCILNKLYNNPEL